MTEQEPTTPEAVEPEAAQEPIEVEGVLEDEVARDLEYLAEIDLALAHLTAGASPRTALAFGITRTVLGGVREAIEAGAETIGQTAARARAAGVQA